MSTAAKLFYSSDPDKQTLHRRIVPSSNQRNTQQERWNDLRDFLIEDLLEKTGYPITSWLQGSYKFATQVRPAGASEEFDIDLGIYFNWEGSPDDGKFRPVELKALVHESLLSYANDAGDEVIEVTEPKNRCAQIRFADNFHIDVPAYHIDPLRDARVLATEEDIWEDSDPKALYKWFKDECGDEQNGEQVRRMVKYFKMWAAQNFSEDARPATILLTILAVEAFKSLVINEGVDDDDLFAACIEKIIERVRENDIVPNPVDQNENVNRMSPEDFQFFVERLEQLNSTATRASFSKNEAEAAVIWQEAFHHFFPLPDSLKNPESSEMGLMVIQFDPQVAVVAQPIDNPNKNYQGRNEVGPIPKECNITFKIVNSHLIPPGTVIEWMVRNEGEEAEDSNDLGHFRGRGTEVVNSSRYNGTHFMDIVAKSPDGLPIGFRRIPVKINGMAIPPRNPKRKPGYVKLRNKKR